LLGRGRHAAGRFQFLDQLDGGNVLAGFGFEAALADLVGVRDDVIDAGALIGVAGARAEGRRL